MVLANRVIVQLGGNIVCSPKATSARAQHRTIKQASFQSTPSFLVHRRSAAIHAAEAPVELRRTCLYEFHKKCNARMDKFAGHLMPIVYRNSSTRDEHIHTRTSASVFDVSHMLQTVIRGRDRSKFIENLTLADVQSMEVNKSTLSVFTNERGGIIDDCIINNHQDHIYIVSNASNADTIWHAMNEHAAARKDLDVNLECLNGRRGLIALQGPKASQVLQSIVDINLDEMPFMHSSLGIVHDIGPCRITRCGYTGEDGFEISILHDVAPRLMEMLCSKEEVKPAGLAARDTLRLEAGLCLHGNDIDETTTPVEAGLAWTVHKRRRSVATFSGSSIILSQLQSGTAVRRSGLVAIDKGPPARRGAEVFDVESNAKLGTVTSGCYGFSVGGNIAMAYLPTEVSKRIGQQVRCSIRGKDYMYEVSKLPFVKANYYTMGS